VETISVLDRAPAALGWGDDTIVFFNDSERFAYRKPPGRSTRSGIICFPNNFDYGPGRGASGGALPGHLPGQLRRLGEPARGGLPRRQAPLVRGDPGVGQAVPAAARRPEALERATVATDMFTPTTVEHYTGHLRGSDLRVAGEEPRRAHGLSNVYLCGTDQGMLGIVGAMLSGITMANQHILKA
jgi:hypothetical protein